jgi:hypothetical protein
MSSTLTLTLQDSIDVAVVVLDHCAAVGGCRAGSGGQHTVARVIGGWGSLALGSGEERGRQSLRESELERAGYGGPRTGKTATGASGVAGWRRGRAAEARLGSAARGESLLTAGVGDTPLSR